MVTKHKTSKLSKQLDKWGRVREDLKKILDRKDYLITVYQVGDELMSSGDVNKQISPRKDYLNVSLSELGKILEKIYRGFWTHPDLKEDLSNGKEIPFEEKKWGIISNIIVQPLSEKFEKKYLELSKNDFFHHHRMFFDYEYWRKIEGDRVKKRKKKEFVD